MRTNRRKRYKCLSSKVKTLGAPHMDWSESDRNIGNMRRIHSATQQERDLLVGKDIGIIADVPPTQCYDDGNSGDYDLDEFLKMEKEGKGEIGNLFDDLSNTENPFA